jgi:hypothetical protein
LKQLVMEMHKAQFFKEPALGAFLSPGTIGVQYQLGLLLMLSSHCPVAPELAEV